MAADRYIVSLAELSEDSDRSYVRWDCVVAVVVMDARRCCWLDVDELLIDFVDPKALPLLLVVELILRAANRLFIMIPGILR